MFMMKFLHWDWFSTSDKNFNLESFENGPEVARPEVVRPEVEYLLNVECSFIESVFVKSDMIDWMLHKLTKDSTRFIR